MCRRPSDARVRKALLLSVQSICTSLPAKRWPWSARAVRASRRLAGSRSACWRRTAVRCSLPDANCNNLAPPSFGGGGAKRRPFFQDAAAALNPRRSARGHLLQALAVRGAAMETEAIALLESVGLRPGHEYLNRLPHELSGGQRQR